MDANNNVYIAGASSTDALTIKYNQPAGIQPISGNIPSDFSLSQNYPNPFNPLTNIKFDIPKASLVRIVVYDILGKEIKALLHTRLGPGRYLMDFDGANLPSGVYIYKLTAEGFSDSRRMIILK